MTKWTKEHEAELNRLLAEREMARDHVVWGNIPNCLIRDKSGNIRKFTREEALEFASDDVEGNYVAFVISKSLRSREHYVVRCCAYYSDHAVFEIGISQPLDRVLAVLEAAFRADHDQETNQ